MRQEPGADERVLGLLGLARRSGSVVRGVSAVRDAVRSGEARIVILAEDASKAQLGKLTGLIEAREVVVRWMESRDALGRAIGVAPVSALAVTAQSFAEALSGLMRSRPDQGVEDREGIERQGGTR
jgi:ribosomal protein L7Ae-like RNA K-turn-binding protein